MFTKLKEHYDCIEELIVQNPDFICISTFNIHAGILADGRDVTDWGPKYQSRTHEIMELLNKQKEVRLLIGVPFFWPPEPGCKPCRLKRNNALSKYLAHAEHWKNIKWKIARDTHLKCFLSLSKDGTASGVAGGRNLNDAGSVDASFILTSKQASTLGKLFLKSWNEADILNKENVIRYYKEDIQEQDDKINKSYGGYSQKEVPF